MNCPYCSRPDDVKLVGVPTTALLLSLAPVLGLGFLSGIAAAALVATYKVTGKRIYKCNSCDRYFIA